MFLFVPFPITSPSAAEAARGGEQEGRLPLDEEVLDAPEELREQSSEWEERMKSRATRGSLCARFRTRCGVVFLLSHDLS